MPELPEVEIFRRYLDQTALNQRILDLQITHPKVVGGQQEDLKGLVGDQFNSSQRWGKNLFIKTLSGKTMFMHFGMTGYLEYYNSSVEDPKYARVIFEMDGGYKLAYVSKRMFGRLGLTPDVESYTSSKSLAPDAMAISKGEFFRNLSGKKKNIKTALLDQTVTAGIGNWIADEILYHTRIYPTSLTCNLSEEQFADIYRRMKEIMQVAIEVDATREALPEHYITRYGRKTSIECPNCHETIERTEVGSRGTFACQHCQVKF